MLFALALLSGCSTEVGPADGNNRLQRTRAGYATSGSFVSSHLLLRDASGAPIGCDDGTLTVTMSYSTDGASGPWTEVEEDLVVSCPDGPSGELALVLDNSGSTSEVIGMLEGASLSLANEVLSAGGEASLTRVSTNASIEHPLTDDQSAIAGAIVDSLRDDSNGWTALYDGVRMGNETFDGAGVHLDGSIAWDDLSDFCGQSDRLGIVVFTDGHENNSADEQDYDHEAYPGDGFDTTLDDLKSLHVAGQTTPIYTIGLGDEPDHATLTDLANSTGASHHAISEASEILTVFEELGEYMGSTHQVCGQLPEAVCGTSHVKLTWSLQDDGGQEIDSGELVQGVTMDCPIEEPAGRSATVLMTLTNPHLPAADVSTFVGNTVAWVSDAPAPSVLVVLDDNHHNEFAGDADAIAAMLDAQGYMVTRLDEPQHGLSADDLDGYDVVWFSNPGYPPDDLSTIQALGAFNADGGGLVLQGDDMTRAHGNAFSMEGLTGLRYLDNGVRTCGQLTNNNAGTQFAVSLVDSHPVFDTLSQTTWLYGDDIDEATVVGPVDVVAEAGLASNGCGQRPAIVLHDPNE